MVDLSSTLKNKGKGGKNRRRGKTESEKRELAFKEDGQEYAQVIKMLGCGCLEAMKKRKAEKKGLDKYLGHYIDWSTRLS